MNRTSTPYRDEIGWMKPMLRFSLINSFRVSYSDTKREYIDIELAGG